MKHKITPDICFAVILIISLLFHFYYPISKIILFPYTISGWIFILTGVIMVSILNSILIKNKTSIKPFESPNTLIVSGPYKYTRNPVYLGMILMVVGVELLLGSLIVFIFPVIFMFVLNKIIDGEEKILEKIFGEEYLKYKNKVGRWV